MISAIICAVSVTAIIVMCSIAAVITNSVRQIKTRLEMESARLEMEIKKVGEAVDTIDKDNAQLNERVHMLEFCKK